MRGGDVLVGRLMRRVVGEAEGYRLRGRLGLGGRWSDMPDRSV